MILVSLFEVGEESVRKDEFFLAVLWSGSNACTGGDTGVAKLGTRRAGGVCEGSAHE